MIAPRTPADLKGCHMRQTMHLNGGSEWFGYAYQCVEHPRLQRLDRYLRKDRSVESTWSADGVDHVDLQAALDALQTPPVLTEDERAALARVPAEFVRLRDVLPYQMIKALDAKGLIEWSGEPGLWRRADAQV